MYDIAREASYPTPFANSSLLPLLLMSLSVQKHTPDVSHFFKFEYDYIIVGAGSAGSTLASRLSESLCVSVLLLEAGDQPPLLTEVPQISRSFWFTDIDWQYLTEPQKYTARGLKNRKVVWPSGKALGGSSVLNANLYVRGNRKNYDDWAAQGATGWSYDDVFRYFIKMENNQDLDVISNGYHGVGGPVTVKRPNYEPEIRGPLLETVKALGYEILDFNAGRQSGISRQQGTLRNGQRCSTAKAYLVPAETRNNLDIVTKAFVRKVVIVNGQAVGVQFDYAGVTHEVKAKREVIMSAGTVNSAQLLMLSGIGPLKTLRKFNIQCHADLPVGQNMQDHPATILNFELNPNIPTVLEKFLDPNNIFQYVTNRSGIFAQTEGVTLMTFLRGQEVRPAVDDPKFSDYFLEGSELIAKTDIGLKDEVFEAIYGPYKGKPILFCTASIIQPKSRGYVSIRSTNPYDQPIIDPNYFENEEDMRDMVDAMKSCLNISTSGAMRKIGSTPFQSLVPGCESLVSDMDRYLECAARTAIFTLSHQAGTAKMGHPDDPTTVVDPQLRVKGIRNLRVVDASIMPTVTSGNTNTPTIMIAEKAADMIKSTIKCEENDNYYY